MVSQKVEFIGSQGDRLASLIDLPESPPRAFAIFAHCFTCSKDIPAASHISRSLANRGIAVMRFDFTGLGGSSGDFSQTNFSTNLADLKLAAQWLRENHAAPSLLVGHSLGGAAVLAVADAIPETVGVATIGAPAEPSHVAHLFADDLKTIEEHGEADVTLAGRKFTIQQQFIDDIQSQAVLEKVKGLRRALLVLHSPIDAIVGIENAAEIFKAAKHPKSFLSLDNADHLISHKKDAQYIAEVLSAWASRFLVDD